MKQSMLLIHSKTAYETDPKNINIFQKAKPHQSLPSIRKSLVLDRPLRLYDFVGSTQFKKKNFFPEAMRGTNDGMIRTKDIQKNQSKQLENTLQETTRNFSKMANTTINRQAILSNLTKHEQIQATKQRRNIDRYREYQEYWDDQAKKMKRLINKKRPSLVQTNEKVFVEQNPDKTEIINNHIVHYWQMSLRNNNPILKRHIKGHKYGEIELEQKLQMAQGLKQIEASIPKLPLQALKKVKTHDLSLTGRSKSAIESQSTTQRLSSTLFRTHDILNQEQVYKINYQGHKKWLGTQNLY